MNIKNETNHAYKNLLSFFNEMGQLKRVARSGWWTIGITHCESVADHSFRCAIIGFCIALEENCDPYKTALLCLCNDLHESRINDLHKVCQRYIDLRNAEMQSHTEQVSQLPKKIRDEFLSLMKELWGDQSKEANVARDSDILECMIQGKEYFDQGHNQAYDFFSKKSPDLLKSKTAKKIAKLLTSCDTRNWLKNIVSIKR
jgi:putative hydrolase of HD superfamily